MTYKPQFTDEQREFHGRTILDLCALGDRILAAYGIGPERAVTPCGGIRDGMTPEPTISGPHGKVLEFPRRSRK